MANKIIISNRSIGEDFPPLVIAELGINHEGNLEKAKQMILDAKKSGAECVKFQCHVIEDEMIENDVVPANANESIWKIMKRCSFSEEEEIQLKKLVEESGMIYLNTPFSREAANRLERIGVSAYKIGSGECNNIPLIKHVTTFGKPIIVSTGMNSIESIEKTVEVLENANTEYALLHVTSMYPTPYNKVRLNAIQELKKKFSNAVIGLSDHSFGNYTCFAAVTLGASILEKHFTSNKSWEGPDIPISIDPGELRDLIVGSNAVYQSLGGNKSVLDGEKKTAEFAYASVVTIKDIKKGEIFSEENIWVKRPGTGKIKVEHYYNILNEKAAADIPKDSQLDWSLIEKK